MPMLRKIRIRMISTTMLAVFLVLAAFLGAAAVISYRSTLRQADTVLELLADNRGRFPEQEPQPDENSEMLPEETAPPEAESEEPPPEQSGENRLRRNQDFLRSITEETPYETRYFSVRLSADGTILEIDTQQIAAIGKEEAAACALTALDRTAARGIVDGYRYLRVNEGAETLILFLDYSRSLHQLLNYLLISLALAAAVLLVVLVVLLLLSRRIFRPFFENHERQTRFITDAGHELKTPVAIIRADAEVLALESGLGDNEWLTDILRQADRLTSLTRDLVELSRMEETAELTLIELPLQELVEEESAAFSAAAVLGGKQFSCSVPPLTVVRGDEKLLRRVVSILLDNAVKYSPEGGSIRVGLENVGKTAKLSVVNTVKEPLTGEQLEHLFDRFYRADPSRSTASGGFGIGLATAQAVVQRHHGSITAVGEDASELTITVQLPLVPPESM